MEENEMEEREINLEELYAEIICLKANTLIMQLILLRLAQTIDDGTTKEAIRAIIKSEVPKQIESLLSSAQLKTGRVELHVRRLVAANWSEV